MTTESFLASRFSRHSIQRFLVITLAAVTALAPNLVFAADVALAKEPPSFKDTTRMLIENVRSKQDVVAMLSTARTSIESMKVIEADLTKRMPKELKLAPMTIVNDELRVDGKASGIKILSYEPMKIKYQGRIWSADINKTTDVNYLALVSLLEQPKQASMWDFFVPASQAQFFSTGLNGAMSGGLIGGFAGAMLSMVTGGSLVQGALLGVGMGAMLGAVGGFQNENARRLRSSGYVN